MTMPGVCDNCRYFDPHLAPEDTETGWCRRHAPKPLIGVEFFNGLWPDTNERDWCGEWVEWEE